MFYNFIKRNSRQTRKENGVYFASLIVSTIAFYVILSLGEQDVMRYLKTIESDAVAKLLMLIPVLYAVSLCFVFFLVYFTNAYQFHLRNHEFGLYLMMGMKRWKLFSMLILETMWNGIIALIIGIPIAVFLTEMISLTTSKLIGMEIIGYQFEMSWIGLGLTVIGFILVQLLVILMLSFNIWKKEPIDFLNENKEKTQKILSPFWGSVNVITGGVVLLGMILLSVTYGLAVLYLRDFNYILFLIILSCGFVGTFILYRGLGSLIGLWIQNKKDKKTGLFVFTGRQLQENVLSQWGSLAISTLLLLMAMVSLVYGMSTASNHGEESNRSADFTLIGSEQDIASTLEHQVLHPYVKEYYQMKFGHFQLDNDDNAFSWAGLLDELAKYDETENLMEYLRQETRPYLISLTSYNELLQSVNKPQIQLANHEVAMYSNQGFAHSHQVLKTVLQSNPIVRLGENEYPLTSELYTNNIVADRAITLAYALIVPDDIYHTFTTQSDETNYWNMVLKEEYVQQKGLMQAVYQVDEIIGPSGLHYESYLSSMGRQLFFTIAGSYTTFYLGIMFLIIANTVVGLKFLMQQKSTMHRYRTAVMLGAKIESLYKSARIQICMYFGLVIVVAFISSIFGVWSMMTAFPHSIRINHGIGTIIVSFVIFIVFEFCYIWMIMRKSDQEIMKKLNKIE